MQLTFSHKMTQINEVLILNRDFSLDLPICVAFLSDMLKQMLVLTRALGLHQCNIGVVYMCKQHENHLDILLFFYQKKIVNYFGEWEIRLDLTHWKCSVFCRHAYDIRLMDGCRIFGSDFMILVQIESRLFTKRSALFNIFDSLSTPILLYRLELLPHFSE